MVKLSKGVISLTNNRIQIIREHSGLTLDEFAKSIKIGRTTLYNYESGKNPIPSDVIIRISITYNIPPTASSPLSSRSALPQRWPAARVQPHRGPCRAHVSPSLPQ